MFSGARKYRFLKLVLFNLNLKFKFVGETGSLPRLDFALGRLCLL